MSGDQSSRGPCVVWGGYGYGNTGDDLVLAVALADLRKQCGDNLQILSPFPEQTRSYIQDHPVILHPATRPRGAWGRWFWRLAEFAERKGLILLADQFHRSALKNFEQVSDDPAWLKALASASRLHLAGGGYLTDRFHLRHFLRPLRLARSRNLPITTSPLGLGPFVDPKNAAVVAQSLRSARIVVRDADSLRYCQTHGLNATEMPDDGFRWREITEATIIRPPDSANILGICVFSQYSSRWSAAVEQWWVKTLRSLALTLPNFQVEGFCFHTDKTMDYETTRRVFAGAGLNPDHVQPPQDSFQMAIANLARYRAVVSSRFHAIVTASVAQIPCVATTLDDYYEAKMCGALKYAPGQVKILRPPRDLPQAAAEWLAPRLTPNPTV